MSEKDVIYAEAPQTCEECGKQAETRPYGKDGKEVCFDCAMKDPVEARRQAGHYLFGESL